MDRRSFIASSFWLTAGMALLPAGSLPARSTFNQLDPIRRNVGVFTGRGGTIGWLADDNAIVVVDAQFPPSAGVFFGKIQKISSQSIDALINTHHHADHTAGNSYFRNITNTIVAHDNVPDLQRSVAEERNTMNDQVYADTTFGESWKLDTGDEVIHAKYYGPAHTSGDIVIHFEKANVYHLGDLIFNRWYPFIDREGGASIENWIHVLETIADESESDTQFIFGHGSADYGVTGDAGDLYLMRDYLSALLDFVEKNRANGKPLEEIENHRQLDGFPNHVSAGSRLSLQTNIQAAWDELNES